MAIKGSGSNTAADRRAGNVGTGGTAAGASGLGGSANGGNVGGMPQSLLNSKYPGASKKKNKQFELNANNLAAVGTLVGDVLSGPAALGVEALKSELGLSPVKDMMNPFEGQGPDVASTGAGYADSNAGSKILTPAEKTQDQMEKIKKKKTKLSPGFTLLTGAGGTLLGS